MFHCVETASTPDLLALHQLNPDAYPYLLESSARGELNTRYSLLLSWPESTLVQEDADLDVLASIDVSLAHRQIITDLPFIGGWFIFLGYEYASLVEPRLRLRVPVTGLPVAFISRIPAAVIIDHFHHKAYIVAEREREDLIFKIKQDIEDSGTYKHAACHARAVEEENPAKYRDMLEQTHQYIREGDIFQANLSRQWTAVFDKPADPLAIYWQLCQSNPAPFAALMRYRDHYLASSSPERLVSVTNGIAETRPIAGTHPRGSDKTADLALAQSLLGHPKERAEHIMLIDLERNDMGRICAPGSIRVNDQMIVESYQHVHHIVSSITGKLQADISVREVLHAIFPGGTITGCPKVRCMEIISELEGTPRGAYTGSLGYISDHGRMDMNILIRTLHIHRNHVAFRAGAGIVSDSQTERELEETRHKARGLINAIQGSI